MIFTDTDECIMSKDVFCILLARDNFANERENVSTILQRKQHVSEKFRNNIYAKFTTKKKEMYKYYLPSVDTREFKL